MPPAARLGDATAHGPPLGPGPGSSTVLIEGMPAWRVGTDVNACPLATPRPHGAGTVPVGSSTVLIESMPAARQGDVLVEAGPPNPIVSGASTVIIGGTAADVESAESDEEEDSEEEDEVKKGETSADDDVIIEFHRRLEAQAIQWTFTVSDGAVFYLEVETGGTARINVFTMPKATYDEAIQAQDDSFDALGRVSFRDATFGSGTTELTAGTYVVLLTKGDLFDGETVAENPDVRLVAEFLE